MRPLITPKMIRRQISVHKFDRIKKNPDSQRVRLFISQKAYEVQEALDAYVYRDFIYVWQGNQVESGSGYRTHYFRYEKTPAIYVVHQLRKY